MFSEVTRAVALGSKYGLKAVRMYGDSSVETPAIDESAMEGAVGIVVTLAAVIIALYITAIVDSSLYNVYSEADLVVCQRPPQDLHFPQRGTPQSPHWTPTQRAHSRLPVSCLSP